MSIEFTFFDLGNVLVYFDHERMCRQVADLVGVEARRIHDFLMVMSLYHASLGGPP